MEYELKKLADTITSIHDEMIYLRDSFDLRNLRLLFGQPIEIVSDFAKENARVMIFGATNRPSELEKAIFSRLPQPFEIDYLTGKKALAF
uniref:Putative P-loop containing nucleoside triphosphate hydrolase n=1 Tax=Helianthus annuus TaxID=4232 RepID=A0A251RSD5_HELAN